MAGFEDIIGQEQLKEYLQSVIAMKKISHAYIINGERASGKEFIAGVFPWLCSVRSRRATHAWNVIPANRR